MYSMGLVSTFPFIQIRMLLLIRDEHKVKMADEIENTGYFYGALYVLMRVKKLSHKTTGV